MAFSFSELEKHRYPEGTFYTCPKCGGEYLRSFFVKTSEGLMCVECAPDYDVDNDEYDLD